MGTENSAKLPYHPRQGERVEWDMNGKTHYGLYVEWLPYPEVLRCNHRVVSEEYGLLTFEDDGKLRPARSAEQSEGAAPGYYQRCFYPGCDDQRRDSYVHEPCEKSDAYRRFGFCCCQGKRDATNCHDFVPHDAKQALRPLSKDAYERAAQAAYSAIWANPRGDLFKQWAEDTHLHTASRDIAFAVLKSAGVEIEDEARG